MREIAETIAFHQIIERLLSKARTSYGKQKIQSLCPQQDAFDLQQILAFLQEGMSFYVAYGALPFQNSEDMHGMLAYAKKGGILTPHDFSLLLNDIENVEKTILAIERAEGNYPLLKDFIRDFHHLHFLSSAIQKVISPMLTIYDDASVSLRQIRQKITKAEADLKSQIAHMAQVYQSLLADGGVTLRNGHYVLPIKNSEKSKVPGIVHDVSDSGFTVYIEPNLIVEQNNLLLLLHQQEEEEIKRLLRALTKMVLDAEKEILDNNRGIGELDFVQAKAMEAIETDSYVAQIATEPCIHFKGARHPFIDPKKVVKNDFFFDEHHRILVLSGPNAGGKTIAMKCIGLLAYMHQCGLAIPTDEPGRLSLFDHFLCDIGDQQSVFDALSTFSGHMAALQTILQHMTRHSLILIDEIGTGTDPQEGEAFAVAMLEAIHRQGAFAAVSSHFQGVKEYALLTEDVMIGSMLFDLEKLVPLYRLKLGVPGRSYALDVAKRHGIPEDILLEARDYLAKQQQDQNKDMLHTLEQLLLEQEKKEAILNEKLAKVEKKEQEIEQFYAQMTQKREAMEETFLEEKEEKLHAIDETIADVLSALKKKDLKWHEALEIKKQVENLHEEEQHEEEIDEQEIRVDDYVKVVDSAISGRVVRIRNQQITLLTAEGLTIQTKKSQCHKVLPPKKKPASSRLSKGDPAILSSLPIEHNVIGLHVDEALESVSKYLDEARLRHLKTVRIIHGSGTGALRNAIHQYLQQQSFVASYRFGNGNEGGVGATVVTLK